MHVSPHALSSTAAKPRSLFLLADWACEQVYGPECRAAMAGLTEEVAGPMDRERIAGRMDLLAGVEIIFGGWGMPALDEAFLAAAPNLRAVFYGAGSIRGIVSEAFWSRGIPIVSAYAMNAVPVAEYVHSAVLLSLKHVWRYALGMQRTGRYLEKAGAVPGAYGSTVGLVSLGQIGRRVADSLRRHDLRVLGYDPYCSAAEAADLGIELAGLEEIFACADVVSLHTPLLDDTRGMITGRHFAAMKPGATFINTARGALVREDEMAVVLRARPDLTAVLDVIWPQPPAPDSPLLTLPNVVLTPHLAGAMDGECRRLGRLLLDELQAFLAGRPLRWEITREQAARLA